MRKPFWASLITTTVALSLATILLFVPVGDALPARSFPLAADVLVPSVASARAKAAQEPKATPQEMADLHVALSNARVQQKEEEALAAKALTSEEEGSLNEETASRSGTFNGSTSLAGAIALAEDLMEASYVGAGVVVEAREALEEATAQSAAATAKVVLDNHFAEANRSGTVTAYAMRLEDGELIYSHEPTKQFTPASTYKLFVAYSMLKAVEEGEARWDTPLAGRTLEACFDTMIIDSENTCPEAWLQRVGMDVMTKRADELGVKNTVFQWSNFLTTAEDLSIAMRALLTTDVIEEESLDRLKDALVNQRYREGVAAAFPEGTVVGGKVGFLRGYLHDVSFVESDKGDFVITVLTENKQWSAIADAAEEIYDSLPPAPASNVEDSDTD